jgi:transcriptional regulator with XRE-family HTH domain
MAMTRTNAHRSEPARRTELAAFLRSRRERIRPEEAGFAPHTRRRTPGLRREEVAQLAGVGVTWYTWLEQGRDINVSTQVLDAVARTLRLDRIERSHLYTLAGAALSRSTVDCSVISPAVKRMLHQVSPYPACVLNQRYDVLAYNEPFRSIGRDLDERPVEDRNLLWLTFADPDWRCVFADGEDTRPYMVAQYRAAMARHLGEPAWQQLTTRLLAASPEFAGMWARHDIAGPNTKVKLWSSPAGLLRLEPVNLWFGQDNAVRLIVYTPADDETAVLLNKLVDG